MSDQSVTSGEGRKIGVGVVATLIGLGVLLVFVIQNTEQVQFHFLTLTFTWPLWLYTILAAAFGALVWFGLGVMRRARRRSARRDDRRS